MTSCDVTVALPYTQLSKLYSLLVLAANRQDEPIGAVVKVSADEFYRTLVLANQMLTMKDCPKEDRKRPKVAIIWRRNKTKQANPRLSFQSYRRLFLSKCRERLMLTSLPFMSIPTYTADHACIASTNKIVGWAYNTQPPYTLTSLRDNTTHNHQYGTFSRQHWETRKAAASAHKVITASLLLWSVLISSRTL